MQTVKNFIQVNLNDSLIRYIYSRKEKQATRSRKEKQATRI